MQAARCRFKAAQYEQLLTVLPIAQALLNNCLCFVLQAREISESSKNSSDQQERQEQQQDKASSKPSSSSDQQQQQTPAPEASASNQDAVADSTAAGSTASAAGQKQKTAAAEAAPGAGSNEALTQQAGSSSGIGRHWLFAGDRKLVWLGIAVGAVVVVAIVQLAFATLWQPPPRKGGSSGGVGILGLGGDRRPYQAVGTSDDQELAELSERGLAVQNLAPSIPNALHTQAQGG